jgi:hypothetical protein
MRYQLLPEEEASGRVLSIFRDVRSRLPFVPAIYKALAQDPDVLERAWLQALREPPPAELPLADEPLPATPIAEQRDEHPLYDEIRGVYGTEHVPSMYKALAADGLLEEPWSAIGPSLAREPGRSLVADVDEAAGRAARRFPEYAFFADEAARPVLAQFRVALPRNLVFAAAATPPPPG